MCIFPFLISNHESHVAKVISASRWTCPTNWTQNKNRTLIVSCATHTHTQQQMPEQTSRCLETIFEGNSNFVAIKIYPSDNRMRKVHCRFLQLEKTHTQSNKKSIKKHKYCSDCKLGEQVELIIRNKFAIKW